MDAQKREKMINLGLHVFFAAVIGIAALWGIERNTTVTILTDEFAYWTPAAWLNGRDWSAAMVNYPYYGYGYGFFLAIVMKLFPDVRMMYQAALVANAVMLIGNYFIAYQCWLLSVSHNKRHGMTGAFLAVIYCSNIFYARLTLIEIFFSFLFWILIWLSVTMSHSRWKKFTFCIVLALLLATHNRALGIVAAFMLSVAVCWRKEESRREKLELVCVLLLGYLLAYIGKKYFQSVIYPDPTSDAMKITDTAGQVSKIKFLLGWNGLKAFVVSFLGKSCYVLISSFFLAGYGCVSMVRKAAECFRKRNWKEMFPVFFANVSFWAVLCITAIYFSPSYQYRMDTLLYGRYHECLLGPLILFGIGEILYRKTIGKETAYIILTGLLLTLITVRYLPRDQSGTNLGINCVGISDLFYQSFSITKTVYTAAIRGSLFVTALFAFKCVKKYKTWLLTGCFAFLAVCWIDIALFDADARVYQWTEETIASNETLMKAAEGQAGKLEKLYFYQLDQENYNAALLQFIRPDAEIIYLDDRTQLDALEKGTILFTDNEKADSGNDFSGGHQFELLSSNYYFKTWRKKSN